MEICRNPQPQEAREWSKTRSRLPPGLKRMSVAHDFDPVAEERRKELSRALLRKIGQELRALRAKNSDLEANDAATWQEARHLAREVIREAAPLELGLLIACAKEVLIFAERRFGEGPVRPDVVLYLLSALDTLGMEVERLRHDRGLC
jgi:hypothetical protein